MLNVRNEPSVRSEPVVRNEANDPNALRLLASRANESGRGSEAVELLRQAVRIAPRDVAAHLDLGHTLFGLGRLEEAVTALSHAVSIDPTRVQAQANLGGMLAQLGRMAEAEAALRKALDLDARHGPALTSLGELLRSSGRMPEARGYLESALQVTPEDLQTRTTYADVLYELGEFGAAASQYQKVLLQGPGTSRVYARLGLALRGTNDSAGALEAARTSVRLDPNSADAHIALAYILLQYGYFDEAVTCAQEVERLTAHSVGYLLQGMALVMLGNVDDGIARARAGLGSGKSSGECLSAIGSLLQRMEHAEAARRCFVLGLETEPNNPTLRHQLAALDGEMVQSASDEYVTELFDTFADSFDSQLLGRLSYAAPRLIRDVILATPAATRLDVLDLGCGTGLVGVELVSSARTLVGVDLSERMLQGARNRGIYTRLIKASLSSALPAEWAESYDIVAAADVFVYVGRLDEIVPAVHRVLRPHGRFIFTVEIDLTGQEADAVPSPGYRLTSHGRFAHTAQYLTELAARNAFEIKSMREVRLRCEVWKPVMGLLVEWARPGAV